ncbi:MAG: hypothetical protein K6T78_07970 [Alicyclobacillus sp.]|nr:hypothetical protein [Alicyclobacillus sp.]
MPVSDVRLKKFTVELDKKRSLCYDLNAFAEIEERFGSLTEALDHLKEFKALRALLWIGLLHEDETLTERQVGATLTPAGVVSLAPVIADAIRAALPQMDDETETAAKNA